MGNSASVKMGICDVTFDGINLGYTKGGVKVSYSTDTVEKTVDNLDAPISEVITKQKFEVKVPLAEYDLGIFAKVIPGSSLVSDSTKKNLVITGNTGVDLLSYAKKLSLLPVGGTENDRLTIFTAGPKPNIEFAYEKENVRVYEVTFVAYRGNGSWVALGDITAAGITSTPGVLIGQGPKTGDSSIICTIQGSGFKTMEAGIGFDVIVDTPTPVTATATVVDECTITFPLPAASTAVIGTAYDVQVITITPDVTKTLASAIKYTS